MNTSPENPEYQSEANIQPGSVRRSFIKRTTAAAPFTVLALNQFRSEAPAAKTSDSSDPCEKNIYKPSGDLMEWELQKETDIHDVARNPGTWAGVTDYRYLPYPGVVEILCDKTSWRPRVKDLVFKIHYYAGSPLKPLSLAQINATTDCTVLKQMLDAVEKLAPTGGIDGVGPDWCPDTFVESHELVHVSLFRASAQARFAEFKTTIDALSVPCANDWYPLILAIDAAQKALKDGVIKDHDANVAHEPKQPFIDAIKAACQPFIDAIKARRAALNCP